MSPEIDEAWLAGFAEGLRDDQARFAIKLLGGDTIAVPERTVVADYRLWPVRRKAAWCAASGGRPGDRLYVSGTIGGSAVGLALLNKEEGPWSAFGPKVRDTLIQRYRVPEPRSALAPALLEFASAAMDVSDGLVGDCDKVCAASGCSAVIDADKVPLAPGLEGSGRPDLVARLLTARRGLRNSLRGPGGQGPGVRGESRRRRGGSDRDRKARRRPQFGDGAVQWHVTQSIQARIRAWGRGEAMTAEVAPCGPCRRPEGTPECLCACRCRRARRRGAVDQLRHRPPSLPTIFWRGQVARHAADNRFRRRHGLRDGSGGAADAKGRAAGGFHHRHARQLRWGGAFRLGDVRSPSFILLCIGSVLVGFSQAFIQQFRFAAADTASPAFRPRAISLVMAGGIVAAVLGPQTVIYAADLFENAPLCRRVSWRGRAHAARRRCAPLPRHSARRGKVGRCERTAA